MSILHKMTFEETVQGLSEVVTDHRKLMAFTSCENPKVFQYGGSASDFLGRVAKHTMVVELPDELRSEIRIGSTIRVTIEVLDGHAEEAPNSD